MTCLAIGMRCSSSAPVSGSLRIKRALAAHRSANFDDAVDLGDLGRVFRTARFEQFRHARQTAGDVLGLGDFARRLGQQRAGANLLAFLDDDVRAGRNRVVRHDFASCRRR